MTDSPWEAAKRDCEQSSGLIVEFSPSIQRSQRCQGRFHRTWLDDDLSVIQCVTMIKTIAKVGNSRGLVLDSALLQLARLKEGDQVNVEVHSGGTITITPIRPAPSREDIDLAIETTMNDYAETLAKLAK